jgi:hypothetical protein
MYRFAKAKICRSECTIDAGLTCSLSVIGELLVDGNSAIADDPRIRLPMAAAGQFRTLKFSHYHFEDATAFACGRGLIAIIENYQNEDMTVRVPKQLQVYMGGKTLL